MSGCLLVTSFALHTTYFQGVFEVGKKVATEGDNRRFCYENHIQDWIGVVTSLLVWHQWIKQPTISKKMVKPSHICMQWLMHIVAEVAPRAGAMGNNKIKTHLVLHLCEDILDHGATDNVNSAYAESAHIPLAKKASRNTQKRAILFTKQAANCYLENLVVSLASRDVENNVKHNVDSSAAKHDVSFSDGEGGRRFYLTWEAGNKCATFRWARPRSVDSLEMAQLSHRLTVFQTRSCLPKMPKGKLSCFMSFTDEDGNNYPAHPCYDHGKAWNDYAMIEWEGYPQHEPMFIHTFLISVGFRKET